MSGLEWVRPGYLGLVVLLIPLAFFWWKTLVDLPRRQQLVSFLIRCAIVLCLIASLAGLRVQREQDRRHALFLIDASDSVQPEAIAEAEQWVQDAVASQGLRDRVSIQYFANRVSEPVDTDGLGEEARLSLKGASSQVDEALRAGLTTLDPEFAGRVVMFTDGNATGRDPEGDLGALAQAGIILDTVPMNVRTNREVQVASVKGPARVKAGEPFALDVQVTSRGVDKGELVLYENGIEVSRREVELEEGETSFGIKRTGSDEPMTRYSVKLEAEGDLWLDNNTGSALVSSQTKGKVLLIAEDARSVRGFVRALQLEDLSVEVRTAAGLPNRLSDLQGYGLVAISDVPATDMTEGQMRLLRDYVQDLGGGFLMLGGEESFGLGGYFKTTLEDILPVRCDFEKEKEKPTLGMVLIIDKSGSMGGQKIELAKQAAKQAAELLDASDQLGVVAFDGSPMWVVELDSAADKGGISDRISIIQAGGGTSIAPAMEAGFRALETASAKIKHAIVLTDGQSTPGNFMGITTAMRSAGITVSAVGVGSGADVNLLQQIAQWGEGRFYFTNDPLSIPRIFAKETMTASKSVLYEEPFLPQPVTPWQALQGIDLEDAPFLLGHVITRPKPTSELILATEQGDPLLASWRFGLGKVVAFTSDVQNRWAAEWLQWPEFSKFWAQTIRDTMRSDPLAGLQVELTPTEDGRMRISARSPREDVFKSGLASLPQMVTKVVRPDSSREEVVLHAVAPGRYEGEVTVREAGDYSFNAVLQAGDRVLEQRDVGWVRGYSDEYRMKPVNEAGLTRWAQAAGGVYAPEAKGWFDRDRREATSTREVWPTLTGLALLLLLLDVLTRRIDLSSVKGLTWLRDPA